VPAFLESKLKARYGADSAVPFKIMNKLGYMRGNKETALGQEAQAKHERDQQVRSIVKTRLRGGL